MMKDSFVYFIKKEQNANRLHYFCMSLLFLILIPFIFAQSDQQAQQTLPTGCEVATKLDFGNQSNTPTGVEQNWKSLSLIGLLASFSLLSVMYLIGKALDSTPLLSRVKTDLIQLAVTALLLGVLYSILSIMCSIDAREFGFNFSSFFDGARKYFEYSRNVALKAYLTSTNAMMKLTGLASFSINSPNVLPEGIFIKLGLYLKPFAGYNVANGALSFFNSLIMLSISLMQGYLIVLNAIELYFLNLLLPAGVVMRCFSPTRDFGGVLIALSLGLWFFFPLLFSFSYMVIDQPDPDSVSMPDMDWYSVIRDKFFVLQFETLPYVALVTMPIEIQNTADNAKDYIFDAFSAIGNAITPVFILPAINWIILAAIVRELSKAMGQEVDISGLARMI